MMVGERGSVSGTTLTIGFEMNVPGRAGDFCRAAEQMGQEEAHPKVMGASATSVFCFHLLIAKGMGEDWEVWLWQTSFFKTG
jgi:hypothetical protein